MSQTWPSVSVVIPSIGRPELARAIESVRRQNYGGSIEVVVVFDLPQQEVGQDLIAVDQGADVVAFTGGGRKGGFARNEGVARSSGQWVAFLDDDDQWREDKLHRQMSAALQMKREGVTPVVGCRVRQALVNMEHEASVTRIPNSLIATDQRVEDYLFVRRRPGARRASFFTSTILTEKTTCQEVPWDASLARHQDWDWLVRVGRFPGTVFRQLEEELVTYFVGSAGSVSAGADWRPSFEWATKELSISGPQVLPDFLMAQTLRYALQRRDWLGVRTVLHAVLRLKRLPSMGPLVIGFSGLLPRVSLQKLMRKIR